MRRTCIRIALSIPPAAEEQTATSRREPNASFANRASIIRDIWARSAPAHGCAGISPNGAGGDRVAMICAGFHDPAPLSLSYIRPRGDDLRARRSFR